MVRSTAHRAGDSIRVSLPSARLFAFHAKLNCLLPMLLVHLRGAYAFDSSALPWTNATDATPLGRAFPQARTRDGRLRHHSLVSVPPEILTCARGRVGRDAIIARRVDGSVRLRHASFLPVHGITLVFLPVRRRSHSTRRSSTEAVQRPLPPVYVPNVCPVAFVGTRQKHLKVYQTRRNTKYEDKWRAHVRPPVLPRRQLLVHGRTSGHTSSIYGTSTEECMGSHPKVDPNLGNHCGPYQDRNPHCP